MTIYILHHIIDCGTGSMSPNPEALANAINQVFLAPMRIFNSLLPRDTQAISNPDSAIQISEMSVMKKLTALNPAKATGPDGIPGWILKENADLLAAPVAYILNSSYMMEAILHWKDADIIPIPKKKPVYDVNKHLRPISLTPAILYLNLPKTMWWICLLNQQY